MSKVLHIEGSPRGSLSGSSQLASWFLSSYREANPDDTVDTLNVFDADLPPFAADAAHAKFAPIFQEEVSEAQAAIWDAVKGHIEAFDANDKIALSCPIDLSAAEFWGRPQAERYKAYAALRRHPGLPLYPETPIPERLPPWPAPSPDGLRAPAQPTR